MSKALDGILQLHTTTTNIGLLVVMLHQLHSAFSLVLFLHENRLNSIQFNSKPFIQQCTDHEKASISEVIDTL